MRNASQCHSNQKQMVLTMPMIRIFCTVLIFVLGIYSEPVMARTLKGVGLVDSGSEFKIVIMAADSEPIPDYHMAYLSSPYRLIVDLPGQWDFPGYTDVKAENNTVKGIRVGEHPDKLRIAIDLKDNFVVSPSIEEIPGGLSLVVKPEYVTSQQGKLPTPASSNSTPAVVVDGKLVQVKTDLDNDQFKLVLSGDRPVHEYKSYGLMDENPPKWVVDIVGAWKNQGNSVYPVNSDKVKTVRIGEHPQYLRVVMDLTGEPGAAPIIEKADNDLIILIK